MKLLGHMFMLFLLGCVVCSVAPLCPILCDPMDCSHRVLCPWDSPGKSARLICVPSRDLTNPGIKSMLPALGGGSFTTQPPGSPCLPLNYEANCLSDFTILHSHWQFREIKLYHILINTWYGQHFYFSHSKYYISSHWFSFAFL